MPRPVVLAGGCAYNVGIIRAFRELLADQDGVAVSPRPGLEGAVGSAAAAAREGAACEVAYGAAAGDTCERYAVLLDDHGRGMTDAMHRQNLKDIEEAIALGDVLEALETALRRLAASPVEHSGTRPIVGMAGDIYTKSNHIANIDLYRWLEEQGLEVWPSPFQIDLVDFGISRRLSESVARLDMAGLLRHGAVAANREVQQWRVRRIVGGRIARADEPGYLEMKKLTASYMPNDSHELLFINVAKIVDFARQGADGIINAICFNCMVGNASAAITEKIRRDYDDIPIITAVYSGGEDPSRRMVLEAFVRQVTAHHERARRPFASV